MTLIESISFFVIWWSFCLMHKQLYIGGAAKMLMFPNISPCPSSVVQSLISLEFAKNILRLLGGIEWNNLWVNMQSFSFYKSHLVYGTNSYKHYFRLSHRYRNSKVKSKMNFSLDVICLNCPHFIMLPPSIQKETLTQICNSFDRMRLFIFLHKFGVMDGVYVLKEERLEVKTEKVEMFGGRVNGGDTEG